MTPKRPDSLALVALVWAIFPFAAALSVSPTQIAAPTQNDFVIKPPYTPAPELDVKPGVPKGTLHQLVMKSEDSKIYPGISRDKPGAVVPYERVVNVYVPAQYKPGRPAPFIVVQDGNSAGYRDLVPPILDNLINEKRVPAMVAVMVHHGGGDGFGSERGLEYDTVSDRYTTFIESEVLPRVSKEYNIRFTTDPDGRATMGGSSGAACAFTMAWFHPELYRRVLSYSGTFVNQENPPHPEISRGAWEYHQTLILEAPVKPIRIWMHVSDTDIGANREEASLHNWVLANQHMATVLRMKGYQYRYVFAEGAVHVDHGVISQTLPSALEWLWDGYRAPP
jgi:enterochelin esterase family protein